jgi:hypothetical protein
MTVLLALTMAAAASGSWLGYGQQVFYSRGPGEEAYSGAEVAQVGEHLRKLKALHCV